MDVVTRRNDAIIVELEEWCKQHSIALECAAVNSKGETIPVSFFLPSGIVPTIQIVTKDERQADGTNPVYIEQMKSDPKHTFIEDIIPEPE